MPLNVILEGKDLNQYVEPFNVSSKTNLPDFNPLASD